jgi:hypothetical protein
LVVLALLALPASARASWASVPVEELVQESDLVVVGTLRDVREHTSGGTDYGEGLIDVREVVWGEAAPGDALLLKWENESANVCPRVEHRWEAGVEGVWLLTREGGVVEANHPQRFVGLAGRGKVEAALRARPVRLRAEHYLVGRGGPMRFWVVYRNASDAPRTFPGLSFDGRDIHVSAGTRPSFGVRVDDNEMNGAARLRGRVVQDRALAPVTVAPRAERRVAVDLREMLAAAPLEKSYYNVSLKFAGLPETNDIYLYVNSAEAAARAEPTPAPLIDYSRTFRAPVADNGYEFTQGPPRSAALTRAALAALAALLLSPFFRRLRSTLSDARLARVLQQGTQRWQI